MDFVDEQDRTRKLFELLDDLLQTFLEITAIACSCKQCAHIQREYGRIAKDAWNLAFDDALGETLRNGGLANAGIADVKRIVLRTAAKDLDRPVDLLITADKRIDLAGLGAIIQVDAVGRQGVLLLLGRALFRLSGMAVFVGALGSQRGARLRGARALGDSMGNVVDRIVAGHLLFLQEESRMAFAFGKNSNKNVGSGHFFAVGGLDVDDRTLDNALESRSRLRILIVTGDKVIQFVVDVVGHSSRQLSQVDIARTHDTACILIIDQREKQMLQRRIFVMMLVGNCQRLMQGALQTR